MSLIRKSGEMKKTVLNISVRIEEIRKALKNMMFLSVISLTLTVPDIWWKSRLQLVMIKKSIFNGFKYVTPKYFAQSYIDDNDSFQQSEKRAFTGTSCYGF